MADNLPAGGAGTGMRGTYFILTLIAVGALIFGLGRWFGSGYAFFVGYVV